MTTKATSNCVKHLMHQGAILSDILVSTPTVSVTKLCSPLLKIGKDVACQTEISHTTPEDCFAEVCEDLNIPTFDFDILLSEIIQDLTN